MTEPDRNSTILLQPIPEDNVLAVIRLDVTEKQKEFVASNPLSMAQAAHTTNRWERAIYAGDTPAQERGDHIPGDPEHHP